jgi:hypothetical protein
MRNSNLEQEDIDYINMNHPGECCFNILCSQWKKSSMHFCKAGLSKSIVKPGLLGSISICLGYCSQDKYHEKAVNHCWPKRQIESVKLKFRRRK